MHARQDILLSGLTIHTEHESLMGAHVYVSQGKISAIYRDEALPAIDVRHLQFPAEYHLIPGMIDMHIHGTKGADVMDATAAALDTIRLTLAQTGVTGFLATTMTAGKSEIETALNNVREYHEQVDQPPGAEILGLHLEGPFVSAEQAGAHRKELFLSPDQALFERWQNCAGGGIKLVTIAPELPQALEFIQYLSQQQVIASIGHSNAQFAVAQAAIMAGATHATHLFNAMSGLHHRHPGCVGAILLDSRVIAEIVVDGVHLDPAVVKLAVQMKGIQGLVLVTDAMRAQCLGEGRFELGAQEVIVKDGQVRLADGTIAGSVLTMNQAVKNMLKFTHCTLAELLHLTCINPAKSLQLFANKGSIAVNKDADLVVLDADLEVVMTFCRGRLCYDRDERLV